MTRDPLARASQLGCNPYNVPAYLELLKLAIPGDRSLTDLQRALGWAQPTVSEKVKLMRERGFVNIIFEGRFRIVALTEKGDKLLRSARE